jgi:hypothetical protein
LGLPAFRGEFDEQAIRKFVEGIRNGIFHDAETRHWVIRREEPAGRIVERRGRGYSLNRTEFAKALKTEFENYVRKLRDPAERQLRKRFVKKMDDIVKKI